MAKFLTEANGSLISTPNPSEPLPVNPTGGSAVGMATYEELLNRDPRWALIEGSRHFDEKSSVFHALHGIAGRLKELGIPYAVVGGMALFNHGLRRFTEDVDILVTKDSLKTIHKKLSGLGYLPPHAHSKNLRDTLLGVRIEFLTSGEYPGDGKQKPVSFPEPDSVSIVSDGISYINLPTLIELKLASGMTNSGRLKDLSDVLELIKILILPEDYADQLNPYVADKYRELWAEARKRYVMIWRNKWLTSEAKTVDEMLAMYIGTASHFEQMIRDGIVLDDNGSVGDDYAQLVTTDPKIAEKYGFVEESEYWDEGPDDTDAQSDSDVSL